MVSVAHFITGHEHTHLNRVCCFHVFAVYPASKGSSYSELITVEFQWLEHLGNHENVFETAVVRANEC